MGKEVIAELNAILNKRENEQEQKPFPKRERDGTVDYQVRAEQDEQQSWVSYKRGGVCVTKSSSHVYYGKSSPKFWTGEVHDLLFFLVCLQVNNRLWDT